MARVFLVGLVAGLIIDRLYAPARVGSSIADTGRPAAAANSNQRVYGNETVLLSFKPTVTLSNGSRESLLLASPYKNETVAIRLFSPLVGNGGSNP